MVTVSVRKVIGKRRRYLRAMKVMAGGLPGGTSFMEDYTYHLNPAGKAVLGAHMLEICPTIASGRPTLQVHPLGIGGKADPARLVFSTPAGAGLNASIIDMGNRFRLLINEVDVVPADNPMPKLPVAQALWAQKPSFETACACWIYAGGAHHTGFSQAVNTEMLTDFAAIADIECLVIGLITTSTASIRFDPKARKFIEGELEKFFFGEGSTLPPGYVPPSGGGKK